MGKSISKNYIYNTGYQLITLLTPLITTPYVSRVLGAEGIGLYSYTTSIVTYFVLAGTIGLANYGQREIAYHQDNRYEQSRILYEVSIFRAFAVLCSLLLYYILVLRNVETNYLIFSIQALNIVALLFDVSWFFQGLEEFGKVVFRNLVVRIISIVMLFSLIQCAEDLWLYVLMNSTLALIGGLWVCAYLPKYLVMVSLDKINPFRNFKVIMQLFLPQIAIQVYTVLDKTMIGFFSVSTVENGYYEQAEKCAKMALMVVTSLGTVMLPRISSTYAQGNYKQVHEYIMHSLRFVWFISMPMVAMLVAISPNFVPWFFGPGYEKVVVLLQLFSLLLIAVGLSNVIGIQYLVATNRQNLMTLSVVCGAIVNFFMNIFLIPKFMSIGATISSIIAEFFVTFVQFYIVKNTFDIMDSFKLAKRYFLFAFISFALMNIMGGYLSSNIINTFLMISVGILAYFTGLYYIKDDVVIIFIGKLKRRF